VRPPIIITLERAIVNRQFAQKLWDLVKKICAEFLEKKFDNGADLW